MAFTYAKDLLSLVILDSDDNSNFKDLFLLPELGRHSKKHAEQVKDVPGMVTRSCRACAVTLENLAARSFSTVAAVSFQQVQP